MTKGWFGNFCGVYLTNSAIDVLETAGSIRHIRIPSASLRIHGIRRQLIPAHQPEANTSLDLGSPMCVRVCEV